MEPRDGQREASRAGEQEAGEENDQGEAQSKNGSEAVSEEAQIEMTGSAKTRADPRAPTSATRLPSRPCCRADRVRASNTVRRSSVRSAHRSAGTISPDGGRIP